MWTFLRRQQQRGAQLQADGREPRQPGEAPAEAVAGREAQDHEQADLAVSGEAPQPGADYPARDIAHRDQDNTPTAPEPGGSWDEVVQPEQAGQADEDDEDEDDGLPLPEGK